MRSLLAKEMAYVAGGNGEDIDIDGAIYYVDDDTGSLGSEAAVDLPAVTVTATSTSPTNQTGTLSIPTNTGNITISCPAGTFPVSVGGQVNLSATGNLVVKALQLVGIQYSGSVQYVTCHESSGTPITRNPT